MRKRRHHNLNSFQPINLTNLIDVIFSILVIFMITIPLANEGFKVNLPNAQAKAINPEKTIQISIDKRRQIYLGKKKISIGKLPREFKKIWTGNRNTVISINADKKVPYGFIIQIIEILKKEGAEKVGFLTQPS